MRKIAIIITSNVYYDYDDDRKIVDSITEWEEVSEEDYQLLYKYSYTKGFKILEQPVSQPDFIATTIAEFKKIALAEQAARLAYEKKQRDLKLAREAKKLEKTKGSRKELYEQLKSEFEKS